MEEESTFPQTRIRAPEGDSIIQILFGTRTEVKKCSPATIIESGALTDCDSAIEVMVIHRRRASMIAASRNNRDAVEWPARKLSSEMKR